MEEKPPTDNQPQGEEEIGETSIGGESKCKHPPFLLTFEIFNHNVHNYLVESGASVNAMPISICKRINGHPKPSTWRVVQLDRTYVKVMGEMEDVLVRLESNDKVCQVINIMVADIPDAYGLVLSRDWSAKLNGYFTSEWSHLWFPYKGSPNQIKILREPHMKYNVTQLNEKNVSVDCVLGNYFLELEPGNYQVEETSDTSGT